MDTIMMLANKLIGEKVNIRGQYFHVMGKLTTEHGFFLVQFCGLDVENQWAFISFDYCNIQEICGNDIYLK